MPEYTNSDLSSILKQVEERIEYYGIDRKSLEMFQLHHPPPGTPKLTLKQIAEKYNFKSTVTVSRRIKSVKAVIAEISGEIRDHRGRSSVSLREVPDNSSGTAIQKVPRGQNAWSGLTVPTTNPIQGLESFAQSMNVAHGAGVAGAGALKMVADGWNNKEEPFDQRSFNFVTGVSTLAQMIFSFATTYEQLTTPTKPPMKNVTPGWEENHNAE